MFYAARTKRVIDDASYIKEWRDVSVTFGQEFAIVILLSALMYLDMASQCKDQLSGSNSTDKSIQRIEPFSSGHSNNNQSSKHVRSRETFLVYPPCSNSSPTFNQHTQSFESFRKTRLVTKSGSLNVSARHVPQKTKRYFADLFTTLIDFRWPGVILSSLLRMWFRGFCSLSYGGVLLPSEDLLFVSQG